MKSENAQLRTQFRGEGTPTVKRKLIFACGFPCPHLERIEQIQLAYQFAAAELEKITHEITADVIG